MENKLKGQDAIEYAEKHGLLLSKYTDPTEDAREDLTVEEARKVAAEDPNLIYVAASAANGKRIELWYDETSDYTNPAHIVSLEDGDVTKTLAVFPADAEGYTAALARAQQEADKRGLPLEVSA